MKPARTLCVLSILLGPVLGAGTGNTCPYQDGFKKYRCDNGECTPASWVCNGVVDGCKDGSDEKAAMCDTVASTRLPVGQRVTARVQYKEQHGPVEFHLCDGGECSRLWVTGASPSGQLTSSSLTRCNARGRYCAGGSYNSGARPAEHFRSGLLVFEVERRQDQLAVWLQGHPDKVATLPAPSAGSDTLNVRPDHWTSDMPVAFISDTCPYEDGFKKYRCDSGECTPASWVCNGEVDGCKDGSDEIAAMCDKVPTKSLSVGQRVTARVQYKEEHGPVEFHLCDGGECSRLWVTGASPSGQLTSSSLTRCNARGRYCSGGSYNSGARPAEHFRSGLLVFEVERRQDQLAVWLQGHPDKVATLPAPSAGSDTLNVRPDHWTSDMPVAFEDRNSVFRHPIGHAAPNLPGVPQCGFAAASGQAFIIKGKNATVSEFPWHAGLYMASVQVCGGSLVLPKVVLTAAHCLFGNAQYGNLVDKKDLQVSVGSPYRDWARETPQTQHRNVSRLIPHPRYRGFSRNYANDIGLIELQAPIIFDAYVVPICLDWGGTAVPRPSENSVGKVVGWGRTEDKLPSPVLQSAELPFIPFDKCAEGVPATFLPFLTNDKFCAGNIDGATVAPGDSGGGLAFQHGDRWFLMGVVSVGVPRKLSYSAFTDVAEYRAWLNDMVRTIA